jgi:deoxycytidylate deaminase
LSLAAKLASTSQCRNKHGAVIVAGNRILATGVNRDCNSPRLFEKMDEPNPHLSIHAEIRAIKKLKEIPRNTTIYVARVNRQGQLRLSKPCANCSRVLEKMSITIVHT